MKFLFVFIFVITSVFAQDPSCHDILLWKKTYPDDFYTTVLVKKDGVLFSEVLDCLKRKSKTTDRKLKKGQRIEFPLRNINHWGANFRYVVGNYESNGSVTTYLTSQYVEGFYQFLLMNKVRAVVTAGVKNMAADFSDLNGRNVYDVGPVGSFRLDYEKYPKVAPYAFYKFDRYGVTDVLNSSLKYSFIFQNQIGVGAKVPLKKGFFANTDIAGVAPGKSNINDVESGNIIGLGIDYKWKNYSAGYRAERFEINTKEYIDLGSQHFFKLGISF